MDKKDRLVLFELGKNARIGIKQLAKVIGLSESSTLYRLRNLYENKTVLNSFAVIDYSRLGFFGYRLYFRFINTSTQKEKEILEWLIADERVGIVGKTTLDTDIALHFWVKSQDVFEEFFLDLKKKYGQYITNLEPSIYIKAYSFNRNYLVDEKDKTFYSVGGNEKTNVDGLDLKIIDILSNDARITKKQIALDLNVPMRTIDYRVRKLEKEKVIVGYSINIDRKKLGYDYYKLGFVFSQNVNHEDLLGFSANIDNTIYVDYSLSKFDFEINLEVENYEKIDEIVDKLKDKFGGIRELAIYKLDKYYKMRFI